MQDKVKIIWCNIASEAVANAFGYNTMNRSIRAEAAPYLEETMDADIALHVIPADHFRPIPGKFNILMTMWEFLDLPVSYIKAINRADAVIVPSSFCKEVFRRYTTTPIHVCHLGVDENAFKYHERTNPLQCGKKFRFLFVGAPNARKGYELVLEAVKAFEKAKNVEIYIKTTMPKQNYKTMAKNAWKNRKRIIFNEQGKIRPIRSIIDRLPNSNLADQVKVLGPNNNIFMDMRKLPLNELIDLYNSAHCFILPNLGEGWGLTLSEAMATGSPCIANPMTGCADFFNEKVGYPIRTSIYEQDLTQGYDLKARGYLPDTMDFVRNMINVMATYPDALKKGRRASESIRTKFTWKQSGRRLGQILQDIDEDRRSMKVAG